MAITNIKLKNIYKYKLQYMYEGATDLSTKTKDVELQHQATMYAMYLPFISIHKSQDFQIWEVDAPVNNDWKDMEGWSFIYVVNETFDGKFAKSPIKRANYMYFFKIVYTTPYKVNPLSPTKEESDKDIGPIAFRIAFKDGKTAQAIDGCMAISRSIGNKRSVSHYCMLNDKPHTKTIQFQYRFLKPPIDQENVELYKFIY